MSRIRVYELARELGLESKVLMSLLAENGIKVASHQSNLTGSQIDKIRQAYQSSQQQPKKVVVRRRRRKVVEGKPSGEKDVSVQENLAEPQLEASKAKDSKDQAITTPPPVVKNGKEDKHIEKEDREEIVVDKAIEKKAAKIIEEQTAVKLDSQPEKTKPEKTKPEKTKPETTAKTKKSSTGTAERATIVRKATPEEVEKLKTQARTKYKKEDTKKSRSGSAASTSKSHTQKVSFGSDKKRSASPSVVDSSDQDGSVYGKRKVGDRSFSKSQEKRFKSPSKKNRQTSALFNIDGKEALSSRKKRVVYTNASPYQRRKDLKRQKNLKSTQITTPRAAYRVVKMEQDTITVGELAKQLSVKAGDIIKKLMAQEMMVTINQAIDHDTASLIASEYGYECKLATRSDVAILKEENIGEDRFTLEARPPIVTVMGHVDHGKTSLLDVIRKSGVAAKEAGGITQHIGAYTVSRNDSQLTFLDTPGHEAFSSMRARGAKLTDIVVLVVAADDGVMPQTKEAIAHAQQAGVPIIVAINKIDKTGANIERIYTELSEYNIQSEEWGGTNQFVKVSAITKEGIDDLLDAIQVQSEIMELKAPKEGLASGVVVEAHLDKARGPVATVIVTKGTLKRSQYIVAGSVIGRVRSMKDHRGKNIQLADPSTPVEVVGFTSVPMSSDVMNVVSSEKKAREVSALRLSKAQDQEKPAVDSLEDLLNKAQTDSVPKLSLIIKGDVQGTVEAICDSVSKLKSAKVTSAIIFKGVGGISESDVNLAQTSNAVILGFNVRASATVVDIAKKSGVAIQYFSIIYEIIDAVKALMKGKLPPITKEVILGHAEVRDAISIPKIGLIAGSMVTDGKLTRNSSLRLIRDDVVVHDGKLASLRRFKDDVKEVQSGYECGISFSNYSNIRVGDIIEAYIMEEIEDKLDI